MLEGLFRQIMHVGSYDDEGPMLAKMHDKFMPAHGLVENGKHKEIYLSDPRRVVPEKLKTVFAPASSSEVSIPKIQPAQ